MDSGNNASDIPSLRRESTGCESTALEERVSWNESEDDEACPLETRWWLASTAFPLLAVCILPISILRFMALFNFLGGMGVWGIFCAK